jgi:hypothetical protein
VRFDVGGSKHAPQSFYYAYHDTAGTEGHVFAGGNSLLAGNLAGKFKKSGRIGPVSAARALDRAAISKGWHGFPASKDSELLRQNKAFAPPKRNWLEST